MDWRTEATKRRRDSYLHLVGKRVRLDAINDPYTTIKPGTLGTVGFIDDMGTIHVDWDDGRQLGLVPGQDRWTVVG